MVGFMLPPCYLFGLRQPSLGVYRRKVEKAEPKQKQLPAADVSGGESQVWRCKEQYCIGTWNVRSINQGKLDVVKQGMARVNIDILGMPWAKMDGNGRI